MPRYRTQSYGDENNRVQPDFTKYQRNLLAQLKILYKKTPKKTKIITAVLLAFVVIAFIFRLTSLFALTGTVYPDGDVTRGWPVVSGCTSTTHYVCVNDEVNNPATYISTGTNGAGGEVEEFTMTSVASAPNTTISRIVLSYYTQTPICEGSQTNCDQITPSIRIGGSLIAGTTSSVSTINTLRTVTFTGAWASDANLQVHFVRTVQGGGNASSVDDDVRITNVSATLTYMFNSTLDQASYRWYDNSGTYTSGAFSDANIMKLDSPSEPPANTGYDASWSPDGTYMSVSHVTSPFISIYKKTGTTFTKLDDPDILPTGTGYGAAWSPDGVYLTVSHATTPFVTIYKRSGDTFTKLANPATLPTGQGNEAAWSPDGIYLTVSHTTTPFITIYKRSGDTFTKLANPATLPTGTGNDVRWSPDGIYMTVAHTVSPFVTIYKRSGDTFTKLANPATLPTGIGYGAAWSADGVYLTVTHAITPFISIYKRSGDTFTKLSNPTTLPSSQSNGAAWSPDGVYMTVSTAAYPFISIYKRSSDTFTAVSNSATPNNSAYGLEFSPNGEYLAIAHYISPNVTILSGGSAGTTTPLASQNTAVSTEAPLRLRINMHVGNGNKYPNDMYFKLQYAERGVDNQCDTSFTSETYADISSTTPITFFDNSPIGDGSPIISGVNDPTNGAFPVVMQSYEEANSFAIAKEIPGNSNAIWEFAIHSPFATSGATYCLRIVDSTGVVLNGYTAIPQLTIPPTTHEQSSHRWFENSDSFTAFLSRLNNPSPIPTQTGYGADWSPDGQYLSVAHSSAPNLSIYKRNDETFTRLPDPIGHVTGISYGTAWSPDGNSVARAYNVSPYVAVYNRSGDDFTKLTDPDVPLPDEGKGVTWSPDGTILVATHWTSPYVTIYKRSGDVFTKLPNPAVLPPGNALYDPSFSPDGVYLTIPHASSPFMTIYKRSGDTFTKLPDPSVLPNNTAWSPAWSPDGIYLSAGISTSPFIITYKRSGDTFTKLPDPSSLPTGAGMGAEWSPDGNFLSVAHSNLPTITIYRRSGDVLTKLSSPGSVVGGNGNAPSWNPDGTMLAVATNSTPYIAVYRFIEEAEVASPSAAENAPQIEAVDGAPFRLRQLLYNGGARLNKASQTYKLQFSSRGLDGLCDVNFSNEAYVDITNSTSIRFHDNLTLRSLISVAAHPDNPFYGSGISLQTYNEAMPFSNNYFGVPGSYSGLYDFPLVDFDSPPGTVYCFRVVKSDGSLLDNYQTVPQMTTFGTPVAPPSAIQFHGGMNIRGGTRFGN